MAVWLPNAWLDDAWLDGAWLDMGGGSPPPVVTTPTSVTTEGGRGKRQRVRILDDDDLRAYFGHLDHVAKKERRKKEEAEEAWERFTQSLNETYAATEDGPKVAKAKLEKVIAPYSDGVRVDWAKLMIAQADQMLSTLTAALDKKERAEERAKLEAQQREVMRLAKSIADTYEAMAEKERIAKQARDNELEIERQLIARRRKDEQDLLNLIAELL